MIVDSALVAVSLRNGHNVIDVTKSGISYNWINPMDPTDSMNPTNLGGFDVSQGKFWFHILY
jgi:hypothetical protein